MIKITADSTCDLSSDILEKLNISLIPLHILLGEEDYLDGLNIKQHQIFDYFNQEGKLCRTAAINTFEYEQFFQQFINEYDAVVHICLGKQFSSCFQNASLAAANFNNVYVINSDNLSTGSGHLVYEAAMLAQNGCQAAEIVATVESMKVNVRASFVVDKMDYLREGGRCTSLEAFGASILKIKPSIEVIEGKMSVGKKYRGSFQNCLEKYVHDQLGDLSIINPKRIFITHSSCPPEIVSKVRTLIEQTGHFEEVIETTAGATISTHCGPNTLGILYLQK